MTIQERADKAAQDFLYGTRDSEVIAIAISEAVLAEREACAKLATDQEAWNTSDFIGDRTDDYAMIAAAIRARGQS